MSANKEQLEFLRNQYQRSGTARTILDNFAGRKLNLSAIKIAPLATQCSLSDDEVKAFFRELQKHGFGKYIKSSRGSDARFEWGVKDEKSPDGLTYQHDYSLVFVGRASRDHDFNELDMYELGSETETTGMLKKNTLSTGECLSFPLPKGRSINIYYPTDVSSEEWGVFLSWIKVHSSSMGG